MKKTLLFCSAGLALISMPAFAAEYSFVQKIEGLQSAAAVVQEVKYGSCKEILDAGESICSGLYTITKVTRAG